MLFSVIEGQKSQSHSLVREHGSQITSKELDVVTHEDNVSGDLLVLIFILFSELVDLRVIIKKVQKNVKIVKIILLGDERDVLDGEVCAEDKEVVINQGLGVGVLDVVV